MESETMTTSKINFFYWDNFFLTEITTKKEEIKELESKPLFSANDNPDMMDQADINTAQNLKAAQITRKREYVDGCISARERLKKNQFGICWTCTHEERTSLKKQIKDSSLENGTKKIPEKKDTDKQLKDQFDKIDTKVFVYISEEELQTAPLRMMCVKHQIEVNKKRK